MNNGLSESRNKAIEILEKIAAYMEDKGLGKETMFDCRNGSTTWYDLEDMVTDILDRKED